MNVTIFSKDRACQLELLLRSIKKFTNIGRVNVIYTYSSDEYKKGYFTLAYNYEYEWNEIKETDFKDDLIHSIGNDYYTMFLTDDAVFTRDFDINKVHLDNETIAHSLMLGKNITYAYEKERNVEQPSIPKWEWKGADIDFNYPMSVIGHIWKTSDIFPKLKELDYDKAWNVESALRDNPIDKPFMSCFGESKVVHIANNVVSPAGNKSGEGSTKELNNRFLNGERIKLKKIDNNSVHYEWEFEFERME